MPHITLGCPQLFVGIAGSTSVWKNWNNQSNGSKGVSFFNRISKDLNAITAAPVFGKHMSCGFFSSQVLFGGKGLGAWGMASDLSLAGLSKDLQRNDEINDYALERKALST